MSSFSLKVLGRDALFDYSSEATAEAERSENEEENVIH